MSECISAIVRSNQPSSLKRRRAEDLDSGGSVGQPCCRYKACTSGRQDNGTWGSREFCSKSHRDYFNAELFDFVINGVAHVTEEPTGICMLLGCELPVWETFDFCRAGHAVKYKEKMTEKWDLDNRLCKLQSCSNHVQVDEKKVSEYCCREHQFDAAAARGKQAAAAKRKLEAAARIDVEKDPVSSDEIRQISEEAAQQLLQAKLENQRGYHDKVSGDKTMENCLIHLLVNPGDFQNADPGGNFCRVESLDFHPFDDVTEFDGFKPKWYLHYIDSKKGRERFTKEGFGWKQRGPEHVNKGPFKPLKSTYFTYELKPSSKGDRKDGHCAGYVLAYRQYEEAREAKKLKKGTETRWKMSQYSLPDNIVMEVSGETLPCKIPVISKIYQYKDGQPVWPPLPQEKENRPREVMSNKHTTSVPVESILLAHCHGEQRGMTSSVSSNTPPPGEGLPPGRKILQKPYSNEFDEFDSFLQDSLGEHLLMEVIADESNAIVTLGTTPAVRVQEERGMSSSSPSSQALCEGLPPLNCDDSSPSSEALDKGLPHTNLDSSFLDDLFAGQSKIGGDNMLSWYMDGDSW